MSSIFEVNTKLEAYKLIHDPARLLCLLYSKYGDIEEDYCLLYANQVVYNKFSHFNTVFKESQFSVLMGDFLKRFYKKNESIDRIPKLSEYYKNYHNFFCKPIFRNFFFLELLHNYQENKAEIFYKNNYKDSNNNSNKNINNTEKSLDSSSSLSSLDNITNNKTIFTHRNKKIIDDNLDSKLCTITLTLDSIKNSGIGLISTRSKGDSFEKAVYNIVNYKYNKNKKNDKTKKKANTNVIEKRKNKIGYENLNKNKNNKNNLINKAKNVISQISYKNINNKTNKIKYSLYTLAKKNYSSNKNYSKSNRPQSQSKNNIFLSAKNDAHFFSKVSKLEEFNKNKPVIIKNTNHKRNKTFNINNHTSTIHNEHNPNNNYSNYNCFSKLSSALNKNKLNITNNTNYNSNSNSHNTLKTNNNINNKSIKMCSNNNDQFFALNNEQQLKNKKHNTFEINSQKIIVCSNKLSPNNTFKKGVGANYQHGGSKFNLVKGTIADIIKKPNSSNNQLASKYFNISKKNMFSNASNSIPKFNILSPKAENNKKNNKENKLYYLSNNNSTMNEVKSNNTSNKKIIVSNNLNISNIKQKSKNISRYKKNNASYINNNFNINFNNVIFCGNRISSSSKDTINFNSASNINNNNNTNITKSINSNGNISQNYSINNNSTIKNKLIRDICLPNLKNIYIDSRNKHKIQIGSLTQNPTNTKSQSKISKNTESKIIIAKEQHKHINSNLNSNHKINNNIEHNSKNFSKKNKKDNGQKIPLRIEELISKSKKNTNFKNYNSNNIKAKTGHKTIRDNNKVCLKNNKSFQKDKKINSSSKNIYSSTTSIRGNSNKVI